MAPWPPPLWIRFCTGGKEGQAPYFGDSQILTEIRIPKLHFSLPYLLACDFCYEFNREIFSNVVERRVDAQLLSNGCVIHQMMMRIQYRAKH